jgi:hypothetical protein
VARIDAQVQRNFDGFVELGGLASSLSSLDRFIDAVELLVVELFGSDFCFLVSLP